MNVSIARKAATTGLAAAALTAGAFAGFAPASASTGAPATENAGQTVATVFQAAPKGNGWHYYDSYFWGAECNKIGNEKIDSGEWKAYRCMGNWLNDYNLWYQV
ncbi:hypothetical protein [Kocuria kalidii]|uniref:hypothetical protein n=1 Tax=Kocuria kalidii TaxID=3376283 RepID=UPI0037A9922B